VVLDAAAASRITVPFDALLLTAECTRDGDDLVRTAQNCAPSVIVDGNGALIYDANGAAPGYTVLASAGADAVQASDAQSQPLTFGCAAPIGLIASGRRPGQMAANG